MPICRTKVTVKGRRFPIAGICKGISFELVHAAKHVGEVPHLDEGEVTSAPEGHSGDVLRGGLHSETAALA